jgi:hypothetical protein
MAQPNIAVANEAVFEAPGGGQHLFARKGFFVRRDGAGHGAGGALEALFNILAAKLAYFFDKFDIRID